MSRIAAWWSVMSSGYHDSSMVGKSGAGSAQRDFSRLESGTGSCERGETRAVVPSPHHRRKLLRCANRTPRTAKTPGVAVAHEP
jgi:hypothetical protein